MKGERMFAKKKDNQALDAVINNLALDMQTRDATSPEYAAMMDVMERAYKLKNESSKRVSPDTIALIAANLAGIGIIVGYEHAHAVTSKALGFVLKLR